MPGSLLIEAMLQTVVTIIYSDDKFKFKRSLIVKTQTSFFQKIDKSGIIIIKAKILKKTNNFILAKKLKSILKIRKSVMEFSTTLMCKNEK